MQFLNKHLFSNNLENPPNILFSSYLHAYILPKVLWLLNIVLMRAYRKCRHPYVQSNNIFRIFLLYFVIYMEN